MKNAAPYHAWEFEAAADTTAVVFPDGCRDVLVISKAGQKNEVSLTDWDLRPRQVRLCAGTKIFGYRLCPGTRLTAQTVDAMTANADELDQWIEHDAIRSADFDEAIEALLEPDSTVLGASKTIGVTVRTLQRRFKDLSLPPPEFWRLLGRARRAASILSCSLPLADIAYENGYSDQAHMTREFVRWFGRTPNALSRNAVLLEAIRQPALGNWTGEQISMR